jgi:DNA polymerase-3 subunit alpha
VLTVQVPLSELSPALTAQLNTLILENAAEHPNRKCALRFKLVDAEEGTSLEMPAKNFKINPTDDLLWQLQGIQGLSIKLN